MPQLFGCCGCRESEWRLYVLGAALAAAHAPKNVADDDFANIGIDESQPVVMTEKDASKCQKFAKDNYWFLQIEVLLPKFT